MPPSRVLRGRVLACRPSSPLTTYSRPGPRGSPTARALAATRRPRPAPPGRRPRLGPRRLRERERDAPRARQRAVRRCTPPPRSATRPRDGAAPCRRASPSPSRAWRVVLLYLLAFRPERRRNRGLTTQSSALHRDSSRGCFLFNIPWKCEAQRRLSQGAAFRVCGSCCYSRC